MRVVVSGVAVPLVYWAFEKNIAKVEFRPEILVNVVSKTIEAFDLAIVLSNLDQSRVRTNPQLFGLIW